MMDRIEPESFGLFCPYFADVFVRGEALEGLQPPGEVVSGDEVVEVATQLVVAVIVVALDGRLLDCPIHPLDLAVGPRVVRLREPMFNAVALASAIERVAAERGSWSLAVLRQVGELDAVVGENGMDAVGDRLDQRVQEGRCRLRVGALDEVYKSEFRCPVDRDEEIKLAFGGSHLGDVDVDVANRITGTSDELLLAATV